jgi:hypothetical protein
MALALPAHATFEFTASGVTVTAYDAIATTVYGTSLVCNRNGNAPRRTTLGGDLVVFHGDLSAAQFPIASCLSTDAVLDGSARLTAGASGWALGVVPQPLNPPGAAPGAGALYFELGPGLTLRFGDLAAPTPLATTQLLLAPGSIILGGALARDVTQRLTLWDAPPPDPNVVPTPDRYASELLLRSRRNSHLVAVVSKALESVVAETKVRANLDRPLGADGRRLPLAFGPGLVDFAHDALSQFMIVVATAPNAQAPAGTVALENALARCGPARRLILRGDRKAVRLTGLLALEFDLVGLVPTLPDPYATNFVPPREPGAAARPLLALVRWTAAPQLSFLLPATQAPSGGITLLDLSTNADQFGVQLLTGREQAGGIAIDGLALVAPQQTVATYALPGISWEAVVDDRSDDWYDADSPDDGPPTRLVARTVNLVRIEPKVALGELVKAAAAADVAGEFTLPFGLIANLNVGATSAPGAARPSFALVKATYDSGVTAGHQLSISAGATPPPTAPPGSGPALPGSTTTGAPVPLALPTSVYGAEILGANEFVNGVRDLLSAAQFFDRQFAAGQKYPEVPVTRVDLSGYGTSMVSDWREPGLKFVGVVRARFDVFVGRTAYQLVQVQSVICPWSIRITRTIIFERFDSGLIVRHDSGWKATGDGRFELLHADQVLAGGLDRLTTVHNIAVAPGAPVSFVSPDVDEPNKPPGTRRTVAFVPVTFDADAILAAGVTGVTNGRTGAPVAGTRTKGYVQQTVGVAASAAEIIVLMQTLAAQGTVVGANVGAIVNVGTPSTDADPKFTLNISSLSAAVTTGSVPGKAYPGIAVALHGTPRLPRDGAWSIGRRPQGAQAPTAVDPAAPIPLVRARGPGGAQQWRFLNPSDALSVASPNVLYGVLQSGGTAKTFFEHLIVDNAGRQLNIDPAHPPKLADVGALLGATDIFPNLGNVLTIPPAVADALRLAKDGLKKTFNWEVTAGDRALLELGVVRLVLSYHGPDTSGPPVDRPTEATLTFDPSGSPRWSFLLDRLTFAVYVVGLSADPLLQVHGRFAVSETDAPGFQNIQVDYGSALDFVRKIISGLSALVASLGGDVALDVGFSGNVLTVHQGFVLPTIPLGLGEVRDVGIDLGLSVTIPSKASFNVGIGGRPQNGGGGLKLKPFTWIVDPLAGNGTLSLGVVDGDLAVYIEAGIGAALAINLAVASGSASIILELAISTDQKPFVIAVTLTGHAEVDVLGGLASVALTLTAGVALRPDFPAGSVLPDAVDLTAMVAVGIHLSVCWVASVDFDGSWQFSQTVPLHLP